MQHKSHAEGLAGVVQALRQLEVGESPRVSMNGRRENYYTHPGFTDYLNLRRVLKTLCDKAAEEAGGRPSESSEPEADADYRRPFDDGAGFATEPIILYSSGLLAQKSANSSFPDNSPTLQWPLPNTNRYETSESSRS